ncbi:nuclear pore complex protein Nup58 [Teleopsis dalmanni]|uniref:nuclear pore complex protein Nup58 n=1 Tax=Teleopsis dalmanni TaxID=139649 RepID=UPI0018CD438F|nr:nuclear pore complex protein Nup58 [Teleopsis dalmanni]
MSGFSFGTPKTTTISTGFSFGTPIVSTAASSFGFGTTTTNAVPLNFGPPTTQATSFGSASSTQTTGLTFGAPTSSAIPHGTTIIPSMGFGTTASSSGFGTPPVSGFGVGSASTIGFGVGPAPAATATGSTLSTSAAATNTAATLNFGITPTTTTAASSFALSQPNTSQTKTSNVPTFGIGGGSFASAKPTSTTTAAALNFGTSTTTLSVPSNLFGKAAVGITVPVTASTTFVGLGGLDVSATQPKPGDIKQDIKVKETQVPDMIAKIADDLKIHIKSQKTISSDVGRTSSSKLTNVTTEISNLQWNLQEISNGVESNYNLIKLLRKETTKNIQAMEMAQRTQDTPSGLQFENNVPFQYFQNLIAKYEQDLINFRQQISDTEQHMRSLENPRIISPEDLKRGFKHLNECFISLAGRLNEKHQEVETQKELYLNLRKYRLRDPTNVFAKLDNPEKQVDTSRITSGPTPFSNIAAINNFSKSYNSSNTNPTGNNMVHTT